MAKKVAPYIKEICQKYDIDPKEALWDCQGTWVMYHRFIEQVAVNAKITTKLEKVLRAEYDEAILLITGTMDNREEWSIGEASHLNYKLMKKVIEKPKVSAYPYAMAEKRGKDRVILKLIGLSGHVYSEEEADDFKPQSQPKEKPPIDKILDKIKSFDDQEKFQEYLDKHWSTVEHTLKDAPACMEQAEKAMTGKLKELAG
jgi:hypothetical protein